MIGALAGAATAGIGAVGDAGVVVLEGPADLALDDGVDVFHTIAWFATLAEHGLSTECRPLWVQVSPADHEAPLCLPLMLTRGRRAAVYGREIASLSNYYSSLFGPTGQGTLSFDRCRSVVRHLRRASGVIDLQPLDAEGEFHCAMRQALAAEGWWTDSYFCFGNWYLAVDGRSFDAYYAHLPSRVRNTIKRARKKLDDAGKWTMEVHQQLDTDLDAAIDDFDRIYRQSWKRPEPFPDFVPSLCRTAARHGWLRLGLLRVHDTPVAAQLWLVRNGIAQIYKLAYAEAYKRFSVGSVLSAAMFRHVLDVDRVREVDYLTGDDAYKADWMSHRRERIGLVAFRRSSLQGLISAARHFAACWWRARRLRLSRVPAHARADGNS